MSEFSRKAGTQRRRKGRKLKGEKKDSKCSKKRALVLFFETFELFSCLFEFPP